MTDKELLEKYPWLRLEADIKGTKLDLMPFGWRIAFGEQMCEEIQKLLEKANYVDKYNVVEIKEKWGGLRWYDDGVPQNYYTELCNIIKKYEDLSRKTCIFCGKPAKWMTTGWIAPVCDDDMKNIFDQNGSILIDAEI